MKLMFAVWTHLLAPAADITSSENWYGRSEIHPDQSLRGHSELQISMSLRSFLRTITCSPACCSAATCSKQQNPIVLAKRLDRLYRRPNECVGTKYAAAGEHDQAHQGCSPRAGCHRRQCCHNCTMQALACGWCGRTARWHGIWLNLHHPGESCLFYFPNRP